MKRKSLSYVTSHLSGDQQQVFCGSQLENQQVINVSLQATLQLFTLIILLYRVTFKHRPELTQLCSYHHPWLQSTKPWAEHQQFPPILPALSHKADSDHIKSALPTPKIPRTSPVIYLFLNLPLRCSCPTLSSPAHQALGFALGMPRKPGYQPEHGVKSYYTKLVFCVGFISGMRLFQVH